MTIPFRPKPIETWHDEHYPTFESRSGGYVYVTDITGKRMLIERRLAERIGRCGLPITEPRRHVDWFAISVAVIVIVGGCAAWELFFNLTPR